MQPAEASPRPVLLELRLIRFDLSEEELLRRCAEARRLGVASVLVAPADLDAAARALGGSSTVLGSIVDPQGNLTTAIRQYAVRDALRRGARIIEAAIPAGKMFSRHFQHVESDLRQLVEPCRQQGAIFRLAVSPWTSNAEEFEILTARLARRTGVDVVISADAEQAKRLLDLSKETYRVAWHAQPDPSGDMAAFERVSLEHDNPAEVMRRLNEPPMNQAGPSVPAE